MLAAVREGTLEGGRVAGRGAATPATRTGDAPAFAQILQPLGGLSEAILSRLWAGQRFPASALVTNDGTPLRVLHPGLRGRGAGPDFREAIIGTPQGVLRGDVELHVRAEDFRAHGHDCDPRYDRLVLHVVFDGAGCATTALASGARVPVVALARWLEGRQRELVSWLSTPSLWREPCHDAVARLGPVALRETLAALGDARFRERESYFAEQNALSGPGETLYRALLAGLGYGGDRAAYERIADILPIGGMLAAHDTANENERVTVIEALLMRAVAGRPFARSARPANRPEARLAGLAGLLVRHRPLFAGELPAVDDLTSTKQLIARWTVRGGRGTSIGRGRAIELLINAVLPWASALARHRGQHDAADAARRAFAELPSPGRYGRLAFLETNLSNKDAPLKIDARVRQGMLALYKSECTQGGCGRCAVS